MSNPKKIMHHFKAQFCALLLFCSVLSIAQTEEQKSRFPELRGALIMGNSHIPQATEGGKSVVVIPTWGIDLDYVFNQKWAVGFQTDIKLQSFVVEDKNNIELARNYPASFTIVGLFRPLPHLAVFTGPGIEYEESKSLWIFKLGAEYIYEFSEKFELGVGLIYENREELYDGITLGVSFNFLLANRK